MKKDHSPYRINDSSKNSSARKNQTQEMNSFKRYPAYQYRNTELKPNKDFSGQRQKHSYNSYLATQIKPRFGQQKPSFQNFVSKNHQLSSFKNSHTKYNAEQLSRSKQKGRPDFNGLHNLLNQVTERYKSNQGRARANTQRFAHSGLRGQEDYQLMKKRRDKTNAFRESFASSVSKQKPMHLEHNRSTANIIRFAHNRIDSHYNKQEQIQRQFNSNQSSVLHRFCQIGADHSKQKSRQKSVKKPNIFLNESQFSISTNFTFQGKPVELSDFMILCEIESGRTGKVYRCIHKSTLTIYAIKIINKSLIKKLDNQRFMCEIKIQMYVKHPNIVSLYGFFSDEQNIYLIMQCCQGGNLFDYIKGPELPNEKTVAGWVKDILKALTYLHDLKIVHRDIKPENIIISCGVAKLCDFGCAAMCIERRNTNIGTFDYLAPQILKNQQYDENVDVWGLGIMTYQLLSGKAPFYHSSKQVTVKKILKDQLVFPSTMSKQAQSFVNMLLIRQPKQRCSARVMQHHSFISMNCNEYNTYK